jgi:hypothetical protein
MPHSTQPLASHQPMFIYLENQLLCSGGEYPSTLVSGLPTTAPPFQTPQLPTAQVTLFTQTTSATLVVLVWNKPAL